MIKIRLMLISILVFSIGLPTLSIISLIQDESPIISNGDRSIEIPFERLEISQLITFETSAMALWTGSQWYQIPFDLLGDQSDSLEDYQDLNNSALSKDEPLPLNEKDTLKFFIPYFKSQSISDHSWWELALQYQLDQRIKISLESSLDSILEIFLFFGEFPFPNFPYLQMVDIPLGTATQNSVINSSTEDNTKQIEYFTLVDVTNTENNNYLQSGDSEGGQGASSPKTVYDRGDFFDRHEFRNTGYTAQSQTKYLAPRDFINGETLIVSGTSYGDTYPRYLSIKLNGVWLYYEVVVEDYFYYTFSGSTLHLFLDNNNGENTLEITLTTFTNDWYWRVDGYFTSYYTAEKHFNDQESIFAEDDNKFKFYNTGWSVQEFAVDVPRGITSATLKIYGEDHDQHSRYLKVYVNDVLVLYTTVGSDFSKSIAITNQAKYKDELKIGIVLTVFSYYWLVYGRLEVNARLEPFPDEPYGNNLWDGLTNTFLEGSSSLWMVDGNENFFLGDFDYYVRSLCDSFCPLYWGIHFYIPEEAEEALEDEYCTGWNYLYLGVKYDVYAEISSSGWNTGAVNFNNYYGSPTDTGDDLQEVGWLLVDTALDFANVWATASGSPAAAYFPLASLTSRWLQFLTRSTVSNDKAYSNPTETKAIMDLRVQETSGSLGRMGKWYIHTQQGTRTFYISISINVYLYYLYWSWDHWVVVEQLLENAMISHSVSIVIT